MPRDLKARDYSKGFIKDLGVSESRSIDDKGKGEGQGGPLDEI